MKETVNKNIGNNTEKMCLEFLQSKGYWCHLFAYNVNGQPCDIIALKNDTAMLIDVKHCSGDRFPFSDIRPNQKTCFELALSKGNENCGFMIYFEKLQEFRFVTYLEIKNLKSWCYKSVTADMCDIIL